MSLINYIRASIDVLVQVKVQEELQSLKKVETQEGDYEVHSDYENLLRKLEADIRNHIRVFKIFLK